MRRSLGILIAFPIVLTHTTQSPALAANVCGTGTVVHCDGPTHRPLVGAGIHLMDEDDIVDWRIASGVWRVRATLCTF